MTSQNCDKCGAATEATADSCLYCGSSITRTIDPAQQVGSAVSGLLKGSGGSKDWSGLKDYYQTAFSEFEKNPQSGLQVKWNWAAFFFSSIWYLVRGMPLKGVIFIILNLISGFTLGFFIAVYAGLYGTYDFYLLKAKGKQLW